MNCGVVRNARGALDSSGISDEKRVRRGSGTAMISEK